MQHGDHRPVSRIRTNLFSSRHGDIGQGRFSNGSYCLIAKRRGEEPEAGVRATDSSCLGLLLL